MNRFLLPAEIVEPVSNGQLDFFGCAAEYSKLHSKIVELTGRTLASGQVLLGPEVYALESRIAVTLNRKHAISVGSGSDALFFALVGLGVGVGDEVLVPDVSFIASATAVVRTGAQPVFVDIGRDCNLNLTAASARVTSRTRAMVFVQLFGGMSNPRDVEEFAGRHKIFLVEDGAQSFGASYAERPSGSIGIASSLSFDPTKVIGAPGSGGAVVTDDDDLARRVRRLRRHGKEGERYHEIGYNSLLPTWAAAILDLKLDYHSAWAAHRTSVAHQYSEAFQNLPIEMPRWSSSVKHVWHKFILITEFRSDLAAYLAELGIPTRIHYDRPLHKERILASDQKDEEFPTAIRFVQRTLSLPIHSHLTEDQVDRVIGGVTKFFQR
jgi:dTDP-4-amino-4,6-dideoxygalactose transaminase